MRRGIDVVWRDDDVGKFTDLTTLMRIQELFDKYNKTHTCVLLMDDLWESKVIWFWLMTTKNVEVALHGWKHDDYTVYAKEGVKSILSMSLDYWERNSKRAMEVYGYEFKPIKTFYPPWNKSSPTVEQACAELGLEVSVKTKQTNPDEVYDFHWWELIDSKDWKFKNLEGALRQ